MDGEMAGGGKDQCGMAGLLLIVSGLVWFGIRPEERGGPNLG